ncbi:DHA2 family efflux MFS transporter permease subunit [Bradyrhizobium canariense]|uniref:MFS transporter, DHA2 family, multidrug resistance protein n=1 Tax=Bradyrhizobium canariense TaxID=255045 RepID=A0A1H2BQ27_9BRAD|nr:DHA2 family efflux MFS transporter permease subunit [Bradyrhizobium canariense]SDT60142.1 MFS transporter, DHA2 family, multidrug resistance protein [Bradyrhizobium canariense]
MNERPIETDAPRAATWLGFVLMCLGMFMAILDIQVVATSLPTIQHVLAISQDAMSWIQTAYLIAEIIAIPLTGWLTRVLTLRWLFVSAISLFTLASIGCAFSGSFSMLICFRVLQGFAGGTLIPAVFSAVFLLFPLRLHPIATTMAGIMAVLAPTVGPVVGGWITETFSWHWLFLINVIPGVIAASATPFLLPRDKPNLSDLATLDGYSLGLMVVALSSLEIALKQAPQQGWLSPVNSILFVTSAAAAIVFARRTLKAAHPIVELSTLGTRAFAIGCALSFCLGVGLFGSVYLMPVFLAYVRRHDAFEIGTIMLVTGVAQLITAPVAGALESRCDPRWLSAMGFGLFALGLGCSAFQSRIADFDEMFWPQVLRGIAIMFCLLPPTRLALGALTAAQVPDASGLFNLMRNLGGAIGIALIDTILYGRTAGHAEALRDRLIAGDITAARAIGLDVHLFTHRPPDVSDATVEAYVRPMVEKAAFALSTNEAWALLACVALFGLMLIPFAGRPTQTADTRSSRPTSAPNARSPQQ